MIGIINLCLLIAIMIDIIITYKKYQEEKRNALYGLKSWEEVFRRIKEGENIIQSHKNYEENSIMK